MLALVGLQQALWILHNNTFYGFVCVYVCVCVPMLRCDYLNTRFTSKVRTFVGREDIVAGPRHFKGGLEAFMDLGLVLAARGLVVMLG